MGKLPFAFPCAVNGIFHSGIACYPHFHDARGAYRIACIFAFNRNPSFLSGGSFLIHCLRPFFSDKFDITKHPKYKYLSDADPKNAFDMEKHLKRRPAIVKPDEVFDYYELDAADLQEDADHEET